VSAVGGCLTAAADDSAPLHGRPQSLRTRPPSPRSPDRVSPPGGWRVSPSC